MLIGVLRPAMAHADHIVGGPRRRRPARGGKPGLTLIEPLERRQGLGIDEDRQRRRRRLALHAADHLGPAWRTGGELAPMLQHHVASPQDHRGGPRLEHRGGAGVTDGRIVDHDLALDLVQRRERVGDAQERRFKRGRRAVHDHFAALRQMQGRAAGRKVQSRRGRIDLVDQPDLLQVTAARYAALNAQTGQRIRQVARRGVFVGAAALSAAKLVAGQLLHRRPDASRADRILAGRAGGARRDKDASQGGGRGD